jgi:hypothetical protein
MDSLGGLRLMARAFTDPDSRVEVVEINNQGTGKVHYSGFGDI